MDKISATAGFYSGNDVSAEDILAGGYIGGKMIFARKNFGNGEKAPEAVTMLKEEGVLRVIANSVAPEFHKAAEEKQLEIIILDAKSIEDIFHTFEDKDAEAAAIVKEDGTKKVKLISGSLSKSYIY